ncbi:MAG: CDP-glycerol glycerophosphotransferase family protein [Candidatus Vogelbacteria bacterium]|nr:CDP-glycerol glycerophosphotransferase family protein [Candidatus Vogelbacteria bacterium]
MKTVVISSFHPHISRNILLTPFLARIVDAGVRVVIVTADYKVPYFQKTFSAKNIVIEGVPLYGASRTRRGIFFKRLSFYLFNTETARTRKKYEYYCRGKYIHYAISRFFGFVGRSNIARRMLRALDHALSPRDFFRHILDVHKPDAVFSTDIQNENDVSLMQDARRRGVLVVGMVRSWDNPTQRILRVMPDRLIVGSQLLADEVAELYQYPRARIFITGDPRYDKYLSGPSTTREEFCRRFNLDPEKKLLLYAPISDMLIRQNDVDQPIIEFLGTLCASILVRFPPSVGVCIGESFKKPPNVAFDQPGVGFKKDRVTDQEISREDDQCLVDSLYHADIVISGPTSIPVDAVLIDKPSIMVEIYHRPYDFCESIFNFKFAHIQKVLATGGIRHVRSIEELRLAISDYFTSPELDSDGRARIRGRWHSHSDGRASERLAGALIAATAGVAS